MHCYLSYWKVCRYFVDRVLGNLSSLGLTYLQGYRARSWIEYSLLKKYYYLLFHTRQHLTEITYRYFLFLLINVVFIFLLATTYWQLVRDLANYPAKIPEKLAKALQSGKARNFFLSYVILQGRLVLSLVGHSSDIIKAWV